MSFDEVKFRWTVFQENIGLLGMQGTGKTTNCTNRLDEIPDVPRLIVSPQKPLENYGSYGEVINKISDIRDGAAQVWNGDFSVSTNERICQTLMARCKNMVYVLDDAHEFCTKQKMPPQWGKLLNSGRNRGICGIYLTPAPNLLNNQVLQSCQHIFAYKMMIKTQIEWIRDNYFGDDAEILLPKERRSKNVNFSNALKEMSEKFSILPKYSYLYRYYADEDNQLILGDEDIG